MEKPITLTVTSAQTRAEIRDTITAGDSDAYPLSIIFSDLTAITGTVRFRFVRGDDYWDRDATVAGNVASLMLEPAFYAATGTELWVSFEDANLYTPLHVYFRDIRVPSGNVEAATSQTYPEWVAEVAEAEADRVEAESARYDAEVLRMGAESDRADAEVLRKSAESDRVTAEANRAVWEEFDPLDVYSVGNKVYYLGSSYIMHTASGVAGTLPTDTDYWAIIVQKGDAGEMTIGTVTTLAPGEPATVTNSGTSTDAVLNLGIPAGYDGSEVPIDDASTAADRVLSAGYIKGQLAAIDAEIDDILGYISNSSLVHYIVWDTVLSQCTRGGASAGVTTTTTNFGHFGSVNANYLNPFDQFYPWSGRKLCNVDIATYRSVYASHGNLLDCVVAWEGDPDFELDGSNGFVGVYTPEFWGLVKLLKDGTKWFIGASPVPISGWTHYEETIGGRWFGVADGAGITSKPGLAVVNETMAAIHARATAYDMTLDDIYTWSADTMLMAIEYATLNSQTAIGNGADTVYVQGVRPYIDESGVNRVVMTDAQSANFRTGVMIGIGTSDGGYQVARRIVTSVGDYVPDSTYAIVNFDGVPVNIATTQYVSAHGTSNMLDSDILSTSGYIGTNSKCNAYYRGRVAHANYWRYCLGAYRQTGDGGIWIAGDRDAAAAADALSTGAHADTGFVLPETSDFIASLHQMASGLYPFAKTSGGSGGSANPIGDYTYVPSLATGNTVLRVGGAAAFGGACGRFAGYWSNSSADSYWYISGLPFLKTP